MKTNIYILLFAFLAVACEDSPDTFRHLSKGRAYEVVVVATDSMQKSAPYDTLRAVLGKEVEMINQSEPIYDVVTTVPSNFKHILMQHRNVIIMEAGHQYDSTSITIEYDTYSRPQVIMRFTSPSSDSLASFISKHQGKIITVLDNAERKRLMNGLAKQTADNINDTIKSMFDVSMKIPRGYTIRDQKDNFLWVSNETPTTSQGIFMYTYFYDSDVVFTQKYAISMRNTFASMIPGALDSSYMATSEVFPPLVSRSIIDSVQWIVQRGFWDVHNDFMGGPFVSFSTLDVPRNRIIVIDTYVYSPLAHKRKRNLLRNLEAIAFTAKIDNE